MTELLSSALILAVGIAVGISFYREARQQRERNRRFARAIEREWDQEILRQNRMHGIPDDPELFFHRDRDQKQ